MTDIVDKAKSLAFKLHKGQKYGERPYAYHLNNVRVTYDELGLYKSDEDYIKGIQVCYLHDTIEDTSATVSSLFEAGFCQDVVFAVKALTRSDSMPHNDYLRFLSFDHLSWSVKVADTYSNLTESIKTSDTKRVRKYSRQLELLYKYRGAVCSEEN